MIDNCTDLIEGKNLSHVWSKVFLKVIDAPKKECQSILVRLSEIDKKEIPEDLGISAALDECLLSTENQSIQTVANTIFPEKLWVISGYDRERLYNMYLRNFPRIKALCSSKNNRGTYFKRLINFVDDDPDSNQLEHIISIYNQRSSIRRAALQAAIFDPVRDHSRSPRLGFPCLQHLQFVPNNKRRTLSINAFYATQQILEKSYGNYLGICRLGRFMASQMDLVLDEATFFVGIAKIDSFSKSHSAIVKLRDDIDKAQSTLPVVGFKQK